MSSSDSSAPAAQSLLPESPTQTPGCCECRRRATNRSTDPHRPRIRGVRDGGGGSAPDPEDSQIGSGIDCWVDDCRSPQSHFCVGIWLVLCRCSHGDAAGRHLCLADKQALPLGRTRKCGDDGCLTNARKIVGRTGHSGRLGRVRHGRLDRRNQPRTYLLNQSIVRCQARSAAALLYLNYAQTPPWSAVSAAFRSSWLLPADVLIDSPMVILC
jgi:hypothetical protein